MVPRSGSTGQPAHFRAVTSASRAVSPSRPSQVLTPGLNSLTSANPHDQMIDHQMIDQPELCISKVEAVTIRSQLVARMREAILRGGLRPGQRLVERNLAETTGTSQATVREGWLRA